MTAADGGTSPSPPDSCPFPFACTSYQASPEISTDSLQYTDRHTHTQRERERKNPPSHSGHPSPNKYGENGVQHIRFRKKRLDWSSASWSGSPWPPLLLHCRRSAFCRRASVLLCCQLTSTKAPMGAGRYGQEGVGDLGLRCQRPPLLEVGRGRFMVLFVCSSSGQDLHLTVPLSLSLSPATEMNEFR